MRRFLEWLGLLDPNGRRAWAFLALLAGSGIMTAFAAVAMYLVQPFSYYVFALGIAAHIQLFVCLSGFMAMFVKRHVDVTTKIGSVSIEDKTDGTSSTAKGVAVEVDRSGAGGVGSPDSTGLGG